MTTAYSATAASTADSLGSSDAGGGLIRRCGLDRDNDELGDAVLGV